MPLVYLDTSVALAHLLSEDRAPDPSLWREHLVSSRLLEYELWTRLHARAGSSALADATRELIGRVALLELSPVVLRRALEPFPTALRTLDALHLASFDFLRTRGQNLTLATYDARMVEAAGKLGFPLHPL